MRSENRKVVIVDWDDTILPSTFVDRWKIETFCGLPVHVSSFQEVAINHIRELVITCLSKIYHSAIGPIILLHTFMYFVTVSKSTRRTESMRRQVLGRSIKIWGGMFAAISRRICSPPLALDA